MAAAHIVFRHTALLSTLCNRQLVDRELAVCSHSRLDTKLGRFECGLHTETLSAQSAVRSQELQNVGEIARVLLCPTSTILLQGTRDHERVYIYSRSRSNEQVVRITVSTHSDAAECRYGLASVVATRDGVRTWCTEPHHDFDPSAAGVEEDVVDDTGTGGTLVAAQVPVYRSRKRTKVADADIIVKLFGVGIRLHLASTAIPSPTVG